MVLSVCVVLVVVDRSYIFLALLFCDHAPATEIYTLSLHDALPISSSVSGGSKPTIEPFWKRWRLFARTASDRKSTRLNSSHQITSYAVFCLKKKNHKRSPTKPDTTAHEPPSVISRYDAMRHVS